jgi:hypothetical protein
VGDWSTWAAHRATGRVLLGGAAQSQRRRPGYPNNALTPAQRAAAIDAVLAHAAAGGTRQVLITSRS